MPNPNSDSYRAFPSENPSASPFSLTDKLKAGAFGVITVVGLGWGATHGVQEHFADNDADARALSQLTNLAYDADGLIIEKIHGVAADRANEGESSALYEGTLLLDKCHEPVTATGHFPAYDYDSTKGKKRPMPTDIGQYHFTNPELPTDYEFENLQDLHQTFGEDVCKGLINARRPQASGQNGGGLPFPPAIRVPYIPPIRPK